MHTKTSIFMWIGAISLLFGAIIAAVTMLIRQEMRQEIIQRDARILSAITTMLAEDAELRYGNLNGTHDPILIAGEVGILAAGLEGVVGISLHDSNGQFIEGFPEDLLPLPVTPPAAADQNSTHWTHFYEAMSEASIFNSNELSESQAFVEVVTTIRPGDTTILLRYWIEGDNVQQAFRALDARLATQSGGSWLIGIIILMAIACYYSHRLNERQQQLDAKTSELHEVILDNDMYAKSSALGSIAASLIHDLRTPLANLQLAINDHDQASLVIESAERIQQVINDIVMIMRDQRHARSMPYSWQDIAAALSNSFQDERLQITGAMHGEVPGPKGGLILLCLKQVIGNALRASRAASPVIVTCEQTAECIRLSVLDHAGGLPDAVRKSLFRPVDGHLAQGCGLGLMIARQIAHSINGELTLLRSDENGSHFMLHLPLFILKTHTASKSG